MVAGVSEATRREYAARMNRVVDHIQCHLAEPLDLERLAAVACFSPFHFHRLFHAWMGETLQVFVHRVRLERAAQLLVFDRLKSISDAALDCGFSSASAFARAFKGPLANRQASGESARSVNRIASRGKRAMRLFWDSRRCRAPCLATQCPGTGRSL